MMFSSAHHLSSLWKFFQESTSSDVTSEDWRSNGSRYEFRTPPRRKELDAQLLVNAGQRVVKKYRRYARNNEFKRLRSIVPSLASKNDASKVSQ